MASASYSPSHARSGGGSPPRHAKATGGKPGTKAAGAGYVPRHSAGAQPTSYKGTHAKGARGVQGRAVKTAANVTPQGRVAKIATKRSGAGSHPPGMGKSLGGGKPEGPSLQKLARKGWDHSPLLMAEFTFGAVVIGVSLVTRTASEQYNNVIITVMARYTALTAAFFVLFLMAGSKKASAAAAWFGLIIDLGLLFDAVNHSVVSDLSAMISGKGIPVLVSASGGQEKLPEYFQTADEHQVLSTAAPASGVTLA